MSNPAKVSFPWTMIDKITPHPSALVQKMFFKEMIAEPGAVQKTLEKYLK